MPDRLILLGVIGRAHGVRGLVRVTSYTADPAALTAYGPLSDASGRLITLRWMGEGIAEIAEIADGRPVKVTDRDAAGRLTNTKLFIERERLPPPEADEYYLADLIGLAAVDAGGTPLGIVSAVHDFGAGTSMEIARDGAAPMLVPFTEACVPVVDIAAGRVTIVPPDEVDVPEQRERAPDQAFPHQGPAGPDRHPIATDDPDERGHDADETRDSGAAIGDGSAPCRTGGPARAGALQTETAA